MKSNLDSLSAIITIFSNYTRKKKAFRHSPIFIFFLFLTIMSYRWKPEKLIQKSISRIFRASMSLTTLTLPDVVYFYDAGSIYIDHLFPFSFLKICKLNNVG